MHCYICKYRNWIEGGISCRISTDLRIKRETASEVSCQRNYGDGLNVDTDLVNDMRQTT